MDSTATNFGSAELKHNANLKVSGKENEGLIHNNFNLSLQSDKSKLKLLNNSNWNISIEKTTLNLSNASNGKITGANSDLSVTAVTNLSISGQFNQGRLSSNSNFSLTGNHCKLQINSNTNIKISGDYNEIKAENNTNLKVHGNKNKLSVSGTSNHDIHINQDSNVGRNVFEVEPSGSSMRNSNWFSWFSSGTNDEERMLFKSIVEYAEEAVIQDNEYQLGIFKFDTLCDGNQIDIKLQEGQLDDGSLTILQSSGNKYTIAARKDGVKQVFEIKGPTVSKHHSSNSFVVDLLGASGR